MFIIVHDHDGNEVYINANNVSMIEAAETGGSDLYAANGDFLLTAREGMAEIEKIISNARRVFISNARKAE